MQLPWICCPYQYPPLPSSIFLLPHLLSISILFTWFPLNQIHLTTSILNNQPRTHLFSFQTLTTPSHSDSSQKNESNQLYQLKKHNSSSYPHFIPAALLFTPVHVLVPPQTDSLQESTLFCNNLYTNVILSLFSVPPIHSTPQFFCTFHSSISNPFYPNQNANMKSIHSFSSFFVFVSSPFKSHFFFIHLPYPSPFSLKRTQFHFLHLFLIETPFLLF